MESSSEGDRKKDCKTWSDERKRIVLERVK